MFTLLASIGLGVLIGVALGSLSGLVPGLHSNTMAGIVSAIAVPLVLLIGVEGVCCMLVSLMIVHTFLDAVPSTFIGVPDADTVLSVLPSHQLYLEGNGAEAVRLSALGSLWGFVLAMPLFAAFFFVLPLFQGEIDWAIGLIILLASGLLIVFSKDPKWAMPIFIVSGLLGIFSMRFSYLSSGIFTSGFLGLGVFGSGSFGADIFGVGEILLPLLSGLFGIPILLHALSSKPVTAEQNFTKLSITKIDLLKSSIKGTVAGAIVGWLPGFSSGTANAVLGITKSGEYEKKNPREYLMSTSAANTANAVLGLAALYAVGRIRSGTLATVAEFTLPNIFMLLMAAAVAALAGYFLTVIFSRASNIFARVNQKMLSILILVFLVLLTFLASGVFGMLLLSIATAVGYLPAKLGISRIYCMGAIMVPVMLFSMGILQF